MTTKYQDWLKAQIEKALAEAQDVIALVQGNAVLVNKYSQAGRCDELAESIADDSFKAWQLTRRAAILQEALDMSIEF